MLRISFSFLAQYTTLLKIKFILKKSVYTHDKQPQYHMDEKPEEISAALQKIGYVYSKELNQFAPVFEEKNTLSENGTENSQ